MRGIALMILMYGPHTSARNRLLPSRMPTTMPASVPTAKPSSASCTVTQRFSQMDPKAVPTVNRCTRLSHTAVGWPKKNLSTQPMAVNSCQPPKTTTATPMRPTHTQAV